MDIKQKILIVDDRKENVVALERVLKKVNAVVLSALNGEEALRLAVDNVFALAILDIQMPGMDGYELADLLRGDPDSHNMPIIFMSAVFTDDSHIFKGYKTGAVDYLVKPYSPEHLLSKVNVFLDLNRINRELSEKVELLAASEEGFRSLVRTVPDIVYRINEKGIFTFINQAVENLGYDPAELIGSHFSKIIHPDDIRQVSREYVLPEYEGKKTGDKGAPKLFDERRSDNRKTVELEVRLLTKKMKYRQEGIINNLNDDFINAEVNSSGIHGVLGAQKKKVFLATVGVIRNITGRKKIEAELARYRNHLEDLVAVRTEALQTQIQEKEKAVLAKREIEARMIQQQKLESIGILASGVAHEINNPINGILNYAQLIIDLDICESAVKEYAEAIIEETKRVSVIVKNLLQFARSDNQSGKKLTPLSELIKYVDSLLITIFRHDQIHLKIEIPDKFPDVYCKSSEIQQVLMNLLTNARDSLNEKYPGYDAEKIIIISVSEIELNEKKYARITVEDRGMGIPENIKDFILDPFYTTKNRTKGTGLGLSISHGLVKKHNGSLTFESRQGEYTKFYLDIPFEVADN